MLPSQAVPFVLTVALSVAGIVALSFLYVPLALWVQRQLSVLVKGRSATRHS